MNAYDILIIGAGPAGLTAAIYARRAGLSTLILEDTTYGGQMANTPEVENYPGFEKISGAELSMNLYNQAIAQGADFQFDGVTSVSLDRSPKLVTTRSKKTYEARAVIIANGAKRRKIGIPGEEEFSGRGVSYCATCDGGFFRGKTTLVIGGGNTAVEDALYLSNLCKTVHIIHRRDEFRAGRVLVDTMLKKENIVVHYDTVPLEILPNEGGQMVGSVRVKNVKSEAESDIEVNGVFVAVGTVPDNAIFKDALELDKTGYIIADESCATSIPGVFVAGDTRTKALRQIVTAAGDGAVAASQAGQFLMQ